MRDLGKKTRRLTDLRIASHLNFTAGIKTAREGHKFHLDSQLEVVLIRRPILLRSSKILFGQEILELLKNLGIRLERFSNPAMVSHVVVRK